MKNKWIFLFIFFLCFFTWGCKKNSGEESSNNNQGNVNQGNVDSNPTYDVPEFSLSKDTINTDETVSINLTNYTNFDDLKISLSPEGIATYSNGIITPIKDGVVEITISNNNDSTIKSSKSLTIIKNLPDIIVNENISVGSIQNIMLSDDKSLNDYLIITDEEYLEYNNKGYLVAIKEGTTSIKLVDPDNNTNYKELSINISNYNGLDELPVFRMSSNHMSLDSVIALRLTNYSDLSDFDIILSEDGIIEIDAQNKINPVSTGKVTIYLRLKENHNCTSSFELEVISIAPKVFVTKDKFNVGEVVYLNVSNLSDTYENELSEYIFELSNDNITLNNYQLIGEKIGKTTLTVTSVHNPLVKTTYNLEVTESLENVSLYLEETYDGVAGVGDQFQIKLNNDYNISDFTLLSYDEEILRVTEEGKITIVNEGFVTVTAYEKENPKNKSTFRFYVEGKANIDYVARLLHLAIGEKGYTERWSDEAGAYVNDTKYNHWYNMEGAWCAMFVSWNWYHAGLSNDLLLKYASCSLGMEWCVKNEIFQYKENYTPKSGDIVFFLSSGSSHTGIVVYCDGTYVYTIEGNASNRVDVWRWSIKDARITGYATPHYPEYEGTPEDFSWIAGTMDNGKYWWNNVPEKQPMT